MAIEYITVLAISDKSASWYLKCILWDVASNCITCVWSVSGSWLSSSWDWVIYLSDFHQQNSHPNLHGSVFKLQLGQSNDHDEYQL